MAESASARYAASGARTSVGNIFAIKSYPWRAARKENLIGFRARAPSWGLPEFLGLARGRNLC
jgi:hypothetical protein